MRAPLAVVVVLVGCTRGDDVPAPAIAALTPASGVAGDVVVISGSDFCQTPEVDDEATCLHTGAVAFGSVPATATAWSDHEVQVGVPEGLTVPVQVRVQVAGRSSNGATLTPR